VKILILAPYPPYPPYGGGTMRIYQLIRGLAQQHEVTCATFALDAAAERDLAPLRAICRVVSVRGPRQRSPLRRAATTLASSLPDMALRNATAAYTRALHNELATASFDIIQAESIEMAGYLLQVQRFASAAGARRKPLGAKLVLDQFNAEYVLQQRAFLTDVRRPRRWHAAAYSLIQWQKLARYERRVMRRCDAVAVVSEEDRRALHALDARPCITVVPNGVDSAWFSKTALADECAPAPVLPDCALVFTGTLDFRPNIDAVIWFAREVLPRIRARCPAAQLFVVGKRPAAILHTLAASGATIVGQVPDARPYIAGAAVYVVPMRIGGGVRLKLLEALALEAPVVSTTMGAEGVAGLCGGEHCLLADDAEQYAGAVLRLLADRALGRRLGAAGRLFVREHYDWTVIVPRLDALYAQLAPASRGEGFEEVQPPQDPLLPPD
jgi:glycosyltransferase involved in cell wall biosynthesis